MNVLTVNNLACLKIIKQFFLSYAGVADFKFTLSTSGLFEIISGSPGITSENVEIAFSHTIRLICISMFLVKELLCLFRKQ